MPPQNPPGLLFVCSFLYLLQCDGQGRSLPQPAFYLQIRVMCLCNLLTDSQASPVAARFPGTALVNPIKRLFDPCHFLFRDTRVRSPVTPMRTFPLLSWLQIRMLFPVVSATAAFTTRLRSNVTRSSLFACTVVSSHCQSRRFSSSGRLRKSSPFTVARDTGFISTPPFSSPNRSSNSRLRFSSEGIHGICNQLHGGAFPVAVLRCEADSHIRRLPS